MHIFRNIACPSCRSVAQTLGLHFGYFTFLSLAGYIFVVIEEPNDTKKKDDLRAIFLQTLDRYNMTYNNTMLHEIITAAINAHDVNGLDLSDYVSSVPSQWHFGSALFFAGTIVTTIGYGNISPKTTWGKVFSIIVALLGIPFTGVILGKLGLALSDLIKKADDFIENQIKKCFPSKSKDEFVKVQVRRIQLTFVLCLFVVLFLLIPAAVFVETEVGWEYFDSFYFCFISLTTIGLGDITPGASNKVIGLKDFGASAVKATISQVSVMFYLLFGLAALSIILALIGSLMKSAAEKTMNMGGKAFKDAGGLQLVTETRRFASSIRKKTVSTLGLSNSQSSINAYENANVVETKISEHPYENEREAVVVVSKADKPDCVDEMNGNDFPVEDFTAATCDVVIVNEGSYEALSNADEKEPLKSGHSSNSTTSVKDSAMQTTSMNENEVRFANKNNNRQQMPMAEG